MGRVQVIGSLLLKYLYLRPEYLYLWPEDLFVYLLHDLRYMVCATWFALPDFSQVASGGLPRKWLQEGFLGSGRRRASQEVASGGWMVFSQIASGGAFKKWLQEGFLGSGFRRASQESLPGGGFSRVSHVFPSGFRRASQEVASGGLPRKRSGSSIRFAFSQVASRRFFRKWLQEGFPGGG